MRSWLIALALIVVSGCGYVSKSDFLDHWDGDGDGWPLGEDCDDDNPDVYPFAPDVRGDGCDADCGREPDSDCDDWPDATDCDPNVAEAYPCNGSEQEGDGFDQDCDGFDGIRNDECPYGDPDFQDWDPPGGPAGICDTMCF